MTRPRDGGLIVGAMVLGVAALAFGAAVAGALIAGPPEAPAAVVASDGSGSAAGETPATQGELPVSPDLVPGDALTPVASARAVSDDVLRMAVEKAPFDPGRRVSEPYLLPEERPQPRPARVERPEAPPPPFRVLGTVADSRGGVAVIEAPGEPPRVLALGEEILGYRLSSIQDGRVVLGTDGGRNVSVAVPEVAPRAATESRVTRETQTGNQRSGRGAAAGGRGAAGGAAAAELVNEAMRRLREETGGDVRMEMRGDRVILTAPDGTRREIQIGGGGGESFDFQVEVAPPPAAPARPRRPGGGE